MRDSRLRTPERLFGTEASRVVLAMPSTPAHAIRQADAHRPNRRVSSSVLLGLARRGPVMGLLGGEAGVLGGDAFRAVAHAGMAEIGVRAIVPVGDSVMGDCRSEPFHVQPRVLR